MKSLKVLVIFILLSNLSFARLDSLQHSRIANLDKAKISTGLLHDNVFSFSKIESFDGKNETDKVSLKNFKGMYHEIYNSYIDMPIFITLDSLQAVAQYQIKQKRVPISIVNVKYNKIKEDALDKKLLKLENGKLYDVPGVAENPYLERRFFVASPLQYLTYNGQVNFFIDTNLYITNEGINPIKINADFDDGLGLREVKFNEIINVQYVIAGKKNIRLTVIYNNNIQYTSTSNFRVMALSHPPPDLTINLTASIPYGGGSYPYAFGRAYVRYGSGNNSIRKPVILAEGIDFPLTDNGIDQYGEFGWPAFITGQSDDYPQIGLLPTLLTQLFDNGYDVILLDYQNGADYIQKNAFLLIKLIEWVNANKVGNQQNVVSGISMGGLVARYALAYMEKNNISHCTRLYVSFDTPHKGANIPIGLQHFIDFFVDSKNDPELTEKRDILNTIASQQLLIYHHNPNAVALRNNWVNDLNNVGYPEKLRKVAIVNGSGNGANQGFLAGDKLLEYRHCNVAAFCVDGHAWSLPGITAHEESNLVFWGDIPEDFWGQNTSSQAKSVKKTVEDTYIHYDNAPGGQHNGVQQADDVDVSTGPDAWGGDIIGFHGLTCFIPIISSLDINTSDVFYNVNANLKLPIADKIIPDHSKTPFDAYYAPANNEIHIQFTNDNIQFFVTEINKTLQSPPNLANAYYNFGEYTEKTIGDVTVVSGGKLYVNANLATGYDGEYTVPTSNTTVYLETSCGGFIKIANGGEFILGESSPNNKAIVRITDGSNLLVQYGGQVIINPNSRMEVSGSIMMENNSIVKIKNGAKLIIKSGGSFEINGNLIVENGGQVIVEYGADLDIKQGANIIVHNNSKLIIEEGANLTINPGVNLQLLGDNAVLEIKGTLRIGDNTDFTFTYPSTTSGFVKLYSTTHIDPGTNSTINLKGKNRNDKILEINGTVYIPKYLSLFKIEKGNVDIKRMALSIESPLTFDNSSFTGAGSGVINLYGQANVTIQGSTFDGIPLYALLYVQGNSLTVSSNTIFKNNASLTTYGESVTLYDVEFTNNKNALNIYTAELPCLIYGCTFVHNKNSVVYESSNGSKLKVENTIINGNNISNNYAIQINGSSRASIECSEIEANYVGVYLTNSASVEMNTRLDGGNNKIKENFYSILGYRAGRLNLNLGYNDLRTVPKSKIKNCVKQIGDCPMAVKGTFCGYCSSKTETQSRYIIPGDQEKCTNTIYAKNNMWNDQGTPPRPYVDYEITHCTNTNKPITLIDNNPKLPFCGYAPPPPDPGTASEPLDKCTDCIKIMTKDFINERLENAVKNSMSHIENDPTQVDGTIKNNVKAIDKFHQILTYPIPNPSEEEQYLLKISYHKMMEAFGNGLLTGEIPKVSGNIFLNNPAVVMVLGAIDNLIAKQGNDPDNLTTKTYLQLDRAQIYRTAEQRNLAINEMNNLLIWSPVENHDYINKCKCIYEAEELVLTNQLPKEDFIEHVKQNCGQAVIASKTGLINNEEEVITLLNNKTNINEFYISPNPVNDIAVIEYKLSGATNARIIVYDIFGKIIKSIELQSTSNKINLDIRDLQNGMYLCALEVDGNYENIMKKIVVIK